MSLVLNPLKGVPLIVSGDDLVKVITRALDFSKIDLKDGDIIILAQKIVSKAEGRSVNLAAITPSDEARELARKTEKDPRLIELVLQESKEILRYRPGVIIVEHRCGFICANAGIDHSNVRSSGEVGEDWVLPLPLDPDLSAGIIRKRLEALSGKRLGVMIIDSHGRAWRLGTVGVAIGISGLPGIVDLCGEKDLFDFELQATQVGAADELAAAASLIMGQAAEKTPVVHARGFPYQLRDASLMEVLRPKELDLFR
jgi:coenzyme F420-0:L-glutamate ligase/coenzyme F420-1:gamma-L-glutamate ligase